MSKYAKGYLAGMAYVRDNLILAHLASKQASDEDPGREVVGGVLVMHRLAKLAAIKLKPEQALTKLSDLLTSHK